MGLVAPSPHTNALDVFASLLSEVEDDPEHSGRAFWDRLCEAVCRLTSMERAGLFLYDDTRKVVIPVGSHGVEPGFLSHAYGTLDETPVAQVALAEDRVVEVSDDLGSWIPPRYARFAGITTLTCTPVAAGGRWLGVVFADRGGGGSFRLTDAERQMMWTLGKTAAVAATARSATSQQARARTLSERIILAREVHEQVMQRLFGISLVLGGEPELTAEERRRCADEIREALGELREALSRPLAPAGRETQATLRGELDRLGRHYKELPLRVEWEDGVQVPRALEPLAQSLLAEALRNADKHARPREMQVRVDRADGTFVLEVRNDGVSARSERGPGAGMGLRLASVEALQRGGVVQYGPEGEDGWRVRLVVPVGEAE